MNYKKRYTPNITCILITLLLVTFATQASFAAHIEPDEKVASVNGTSIFYKDVQVKASDIKTQLLFMYGKATLPNIDAKVFSIKTTQERSGLLDKARDIISHQKLRQLHIVFNVGQFETAWEKFKKDQNLDKTAQKMRSSSIAVYNALNEVYEKGEDPDKVYQQVLSKKEMSRKQWQLYLKRYNTSENRKKLKKSFSQIGISFLRSSKQFYRNIWNRKMLYKNIDPILSKGDPIFAYFKKILPHYYTSWDLNNVPISGDEIDAEDYLPIVRRQWEDRNYQSAKVMIYDERFEGSLKPLKDTLPRRLLEKRNKIRLKYIALNAGDPNYDVNTFFKLPSKMPVFDKNEVEYLIKTITKPQHAMILKSGYFGSNMKHPYPSLDGVDVLMKSKGQISKGSLHWFILLSTQGYAEFNTPNLVSYGKETYYNDIFKSIPFAHTPLRRAVLRQSIIDVVSSIAKTASKRNLIYKNVLSDLLVNAREVSRKLQKESPDVPSLKSLDWEGAFRRIQALPNFTELKNGQVKGHEK